MLGALFFAALMIVHGVQVEMGVRADGGTVPVPPTPPPVIEGREMVVEPRRPNGPLFTVVHRRPFPNATAGCTSEDAMFRLPAQRGLQLALARALAAGTFSRACLTEVLPRAILSHPVAVVEALLRQGATPTRAHLALAALPRACDEYGLALREKNAHDLAKRRRAVWTALVEAKPEGLTAAEEKDWLQNITLCYAEYWMGEYQDLWADAGADLPEDAPHRAWAHAGVNADGTPTQPEDWQFMGVRKPTEEELHRGPETGRERL
jgi:hypothetical protein